MMPAWRILNRRCLAALLLGFASGLPLALSGATLQAWLTTEGLSLKTIGWFSAAGYPYAWKFLWAPLLDRYRLPLLGRRRGWMVLLQLALAAAVAGLAVVPLPQGLPWLAALAVLVAFLSASQDTVIDGWRTEILLPDERGLGTGAAVLGYRLGMLVSGALALIAAASLGWRPVLAVLALLMAVLPLFSLWAPEPAADPARAAPRDLREAVVGPLRDLMGRHALPWLMLALVVLYKISDAFQLALSTTFLLRGAGFTLQQVGWVNKVVALIASVLGVMAGGAGLARLGLVRALLLFGVLQSATSLLFVVLALRGPDLPLMIAAVSSENFASGMGTAAFATLLMGLCSARYSATQYALLSAMAALGRINAGPLAGVLVQDWGWPLFFAFAAASGLPGLLLVWRLRVPIAATEALPAPASGRA
ncbi:MAG: MFS transporter [Pseudomonadota bacterium]|nr:MFS transporter [Pseudomonadota bacterium]